MQNFCKNEGLCASSPWDGAGFPGRLEQAKGRLSTHAFALKCEISESTFRKYLAGTSVPGADKLFRIAHVAGVSPVWLATGRERPDDRAGLARQTAVNSELLREVLLGVEAGLEEIDGAMTAEKKAELIALIYDIYATGEPLQKAQVLRLVKPLVKLAS
jgi:transcriptional regulator with XRE-family HTH domain